MTPRLLARVKNVCSRKESKRKKKSNVSKEIIHVQLSWSSSQINKHTSKLIIYITRKCKIWDLL